MFITLYSVGSCLSATPAFRGTPRSVIGFFFYNPTPRLCPGSHRTRAAFLAHPRNPGGAEAEKGAVPRPRRAPVSHLPRRPHHPAPGSPPRTHLLLLQAAHGSTLEGPRAPRGLAAPLPAARARPQAPRPPRSVPAQAAQRGA